jgi:hypothetical protein
VCVGDGDMFMHIVVGVVGCGGTVRLLMLSLSMFGRCGKGKYGLESTFD